MPTGRHFTVQVLLNVNFSSFVPVPAELMLTSLFLSLMRLRHPDSSIRVGIVMVGAL